MMHGQQNIKFKQEWLFYMPHYLTQEASALCQQMNLGASIIRI
jgi:hypothetical protein